MKHISAMTHFGHGLHEFITHITYTFNTFFDISDKSGDAGTLLDPVATLPGPLALAVTHLNL